MVKCYRRSVTLSDLWVSSHERFSDFYASSWHRGESPVPLLALRLVLASLAVAILAWSLYEGGSPYWLIYLTNWGLTLVTAMTLSGVLVSCLALCTRYTDDDELPWYMSIYWFLYNVSVGVAIMITALYWLLLYNPEAYQEEDRRMFWLDVATHGANSCIALAEVLAARTPTRFLHFYHPLGVGLWYAAFSAIYYAAGGKDPNGFPFIYEILDWRQRRRSVVVVCLSGVTLIIVYALIWVIAFFRDRMSTALFRTTSIELTSSTRNLPSPAPSGLV